MLRSTAKVAAAHSIPIRKAESLMHSCRTHLYLRWTTAAAADWCGGFKKTGDGWHCTWRTVRPIPQTDDFFENVWRSYRETGNVD